jgi:hypothetical protein
MKLKKQIFYSLKIKTLNSNFLKILNLNNNFFFKNLSFKKKYIVSKSPFKYNKAKEQFALVYKLSSVSISNLLVFPKVFELFIKFYYFFSNKFLLKLKLKENFIY